MSNAACFSSPSSLGFLNARWAAAALVAVLAAAGCDNTPVPGFFGDGGGSSVGLACNTRADCTGGPATVDCCLGHCTDTAVDPRHCGACGQGCAAVAHAASLVCTAGQCSVGVCESGFGNCDGRHENGCETDLANDNANCGRCGGSCVSGPHGSALCGGSRCNVSCDPPYADCDGNLVNGCEVDLASDRNNCSACGSACAAPPNGVAGCTVGHCGLAACVPGFGDCDGNVANGCETDVSGDINNCGACGKVCGSNNATTKCGLGLCITRCNAGFADCDNDSANGCEASLGSDPKNCGTCGIVCPNGQSCAAGKCVAGLYAPVGPQVNVPVASLAGWSQCYLDTNIGMALSVAQVLAMCPKQKLLMACRKTNAPTLDLLAWAPRADVLFPTGMQLCGPAFVPHQANGTGWYFDSNMSWGFAAGGDTVSLCSCDTGASNPTLRQCWHSSGGNLSVGYRCGNTIINGQAYDRIIYQAD